MARLTEEQKKARKELAEIGKQLDKECGRDRVKRHDIGDPDLMYRSFMLLRSLEVTEGGWYYGRGWMTAKYMRDCVDRWARRSYETRADQYLKQKFSVAVDIERLKEIDREYDLRAGVAQCGGCQWYAAIDSDYGICCNKDSENDGHITFEHGGCIKHSEIQKLLG